MEYIILSITIGMFIFNEILLFVVTNDNITTKFTTITLDDTLKDWIQCILLYMLYFILAIPLSIVIIISWLFLNLALKNKNIKI